MLKKYKLDPTKTIYIGDSKNDIIPSKKAWISSIYLDCNIASSSDITEDKIKLILSADASITEFRDIRMVLTKKY